MRHHRLVRFDTRSGDGTIGRFEQWVTIEEDDRDNRPNISSIPTGAYVCERTMYNRGGYETFEVTGVPDRSEIKFHVANTEEDVQGCIGLGLRLGVLEEDDEDLNVRRHKLAVLSSRDAFNQFMRFFDGVDRWVLVVEDYQS